MTDFARQYIISRDKQVAGERLRVLPAYRALIQARDQARRRSAANTFRMRVIDARTTDEAMVVRSLTEALDASHRGEHQEAAEYLKTAEKLLPGFFEVWRVSAQAKDRAGDVIGAMGDYERAVELAEGRSAPLLNFYADFLARQDQFDEAVAILHDMAAQPTAATETIAMYAWMLTLSGRIDEAVDAFDSVHADLFELGGKARSVFVTQYMETLRRKAEVLIERKLSRDAAQAALRALALGRDAQMLDMVDDRMLGTAYKCIEEAARAIGRECRATEWEQLAALLNELGRPFTEIPAGLDGIQMLRDSCAAISASPEFRQLFAAYVGAASDGRETRDDAQLRGRLKPIAYGRRFAFIAGDDGSDYYLHPGQVLEPTWEELIRLDRPTVTFEPAPPIREGQLKQAMNVRWSPSTGGSG